MKYSPLQRSISATLVPKSGKPPVACTIQGVRLHNGKVQLVIESSVCRYADPSEIVENLVKEKPVENNHPITVRRGRTYKDGGSVQWIFSDGVVVLQNMGIRSLTKGQFLSGGVVINPLHKDWWRIKMIYDKNGYPTSYMQVSQKLY